MMETFTGGDRKKGGGREEGSWTKEEGRERERQKKRKMKGETMVYKELLWITNNVIKTQ